MKSSLAPSFRKRLAALPRVHQQHRQECLCHTRCGAAPEGSEGFERSEYPSLGDVEEVFAQRHNEIELAKALGLVFDTDPALIDSRGQTQAAPVGSDPPSTETSDAEDDPANNQ